MGQEPSRGCPVTPACDLQNPKSPAAERNCQCRAFEAFERSTAIWAAHSRDMP